MTFDRAAIDAIAQPILSRIATALAADRYYLVQYPTPSWLTVNVGSQTWLPAFRDPLDAQQIQPPGTDVIALATLEILWRALGLQHTQGVIFYDQPGDRRWGKQVLIEPVKQAIAAQWQQHIA